MIEILEGDMREWLVDLKDEGCRVDAIVTDPPYHLTTGKKGGTGPASLNENSPAGRARISTGFMGKAWDGGDIAFQPETWRLCWELLPPGGHLLAFGGTRTFHRIVCAIEDAGFEIRDTICWLYGSGFPKSHNVGKAIDKAGGMSPREQSTLLRERREAAGMARCDVAVAVGCTESSIRDWEEGRARTKGGAIEWIIPSDEYRAKLADLLGYSADQRRLVGVTTDRRADGTVIGLGHSGTLREGGISPLAASWEGWGTALKPAYEPIVLARKPLIGTVAENVLEHGTGAINVDACRVDTNGEDLGDPSRFLSSDKNLHDGWQRPHKADADKMGERANNRFARTSSLGRWPANVVLSYPEDEYVLRSDVTAEQKAELYRWLSENT